MPDKDLPLITDPDEITPENHPELYNELCEGCEEGECASYE